MAGMQKKFVKNLFFILFLNILIKTFWILGVDRTVQNVVGASEYGFYSSLLSFSFLLNILLDLGITSYNNRNIAQHSHLLKKYFSGIILLRLALAFIYVTISIVAGWILGYNYKQLSLLMVLLLNQALAAFILYLRSNISGLQLFKTESIISVLDRFLMIVFCSIILWSGLFKSIIKIEWFVFAQTMAYLITALITFMIVAQKANFQRLKWDRKFFLVILKQSYPFALLILLMAFYYRVDAVMIERLLTNGKEQAGIYAQAFRLLDAGNMIPYLISVLLFPMFSLMIKNKQSPEELVELAFSFIATPSIILMAFSVFYSEELMGMLYHEHVQASANVFRVVMNCFLALSSVYIFGTLLTASGNLRQLNYIALGGMILNISLNFYLIPRFEAMGAAMASVITQYLTAGAQMLLAHHLFKFQYRWWLFSRYIIFAALTFLIFGYMSRLNDHWIISCIVASFLCLIISFVLYLVKPRSILALIKQPQST